VGRLASAVRVSASFHKKILAGSVLGYGSKKRGDELIGYVRVAV